MKKFLKRLKDATIVLLDGKIKEPIDPRTPQVECGWENDKYLFDFKAGYRSTWSSVGGGTLTVGNNGQPVITPTVIEKVIVTPRQVLSELETIPTPWSLEMLDGKISILKDKEKLIRQEYTKREILALIERLTNRKKYIENKEFFDQFQNTNDEKIDAFLLKHKFLMKTSDIFIPEFPNDAITTMNQYTEKVKEICGKEPIFYVIAEEDQFKKAYEKRDPILLAQSPFGFYWQILGAWDKEMLLLHEL